MSAFIAHTGGISLLTLNGTPSPTIQSLPLPSRFHTPTRRNLHPSPKLTVSRSSSHAFLWAHVHNTIWEYDQLGRRISEFTVREGPVKDHDVIRLAQAVGKGIDGREEVAVFWEGQCVIMQKDREGRWDKVKTLRVNGHTRFAGRSKDGTVLALASYRSNSVTLHHLISGKVQIVSIVDAEKHPSNSTEISSLIFSPSAPNDLYITSEVGLQVIDIATAFQESPLQPPKISSLNPFGPGKEIEDGDRYFGMAIAPVHPSGGGTGDLIVVQGCVFATALYCTGIPPKEIRPRTLDLLADTVEFVDSCTLLLNASEEVKYPFSMLDLTKEDAREVTIHFPHHVLGIHCIPYQPPNVPRPSAAPVMQPSTASRRILGESQQSKNGQTPPTARPSTASGKGKGKEVVHTSEVIPRSKSELGVHKRTVVPSSTTINLRGEGGRTVSDDQGKSRTKDRRRVSHMDPPSTSAPIPTAQPQRQTTSSAIRKTEQFRSSTRIVSEPIPAETPIASSSSSRSVSAQVPPRHVQPRASVAGERPASRAGPGPSGLSPIVDETINEEEEGVGAAEEEEGEEEDLDLRWAINRIKADPQAERESKESEGEIGYLRKEMVRMQMDMLRMNRDLKGYIKEAISPVLKELEEQKSLIGIQQREIERLRCRI